jgi:hypothetical protein
VHQVGYLTEIEAYNVTTLDIQDFREIFHSPVRMRFFGTTLTKKLALMNSLKTD